jgi:hypothetical protein
MGSIHGSSKRWDGAERRSGQDRRQIESESPTGHERRKRPEPRQMTVVELFFSPEQWRVAQRHWLPSGTPEARSL